MGATVNTMVQHCSFSIVAWSWETDSIKATTEEYLPKWKEAWIKEIIISRIKRLLLPNVQIQKQLIAK